MQEKAAFWRVRTTQLEPGGYSGSIRGIHTPLMQLALSVRSNSTKIEGFVPERSLVLALPVSEESSIQNRGRPLAENAIIANDHTEGIEFSFKGPLKIITVAVSVGEIERRARNLWGEAFEDRKSVGALWLPDASARMFATRKVNAILFETMRDPFAVVSPRGCREVENAVLDTILSSVLDRSRPEGTRFRHKIAGKAEAYLRTCCRDSISIYRLAFLKCPGRLFGGGTVPGTSCQATIAPSLRDISQRHLAKVPAEGAVPEPKGKPLMCLASCSNPPRPRRRPRLGMEAVFENGRGLNGESNRREFRLYQPAEKRRRGRRTRTSTRRIQK